MSSLPDPTAQPDEQITQGPQGEEQADAIRILIGGQVTRQDLLRAYRLHFKPTPLALAVRIAFVAMALLVAIVVGLFDASVVLLVMSLLLLTMAWWLPYVSVSTQWSKAQALHEPWQGVATTSSLRFGGTRFQSETAWSLFVTYKRTEEIVLLYLHAQVMNILPRTLFASESDWQAFRQLVESKVPRKMARGLAYWIWIVLAAMLLIVALIAFIYAWQP